jgi:hypothetical protein
VAYLSRHSSSSSATLPRWPPIDADDSRLLVPRLPRLVSGQAPGSGEQLSDRVRCSPCFHALARFSTSSARDMDDGPSAADVDVPYAKPSAAARLLAEFWWGVLCAELEEVSLGVAGSITWLRIFIIQSCWRSSTAVARRLGSRTKHFSRKSMP